MLQRDAVQKLHDDEGLALFLPNLMNGANIGMVQRGSCLSFPLKPGQRLRVFGHFMWQKFEGDKAVQRDVLGLVHDSHTTTAEFFDDPVVRNGLAEHWANLTWTKRDKSMNNKAVNWVSLGAAAGR